MSRKSALRKWREIDAQVYDFVMATDSSESEHDTDFANNVPSANEPSTSTSSFNGSDNSDASTDEEFDCEIDDNDDASDESGEENWEDTSSDDSEPEFKEQLAKWVTKNNVSVLATKGLLTILRGQGFDLPKDCRTLKKTPKHIELEEKCGGQYIYFGLASGILQCLSENEQFCSNNNHIKLLVNVDGVPLYKSNNKQMWPILCSFDNNNPFIAGIFCGDAKPNSVSDYMQQFLEEFNVLKMDGIFYSDKLFRVSLFAFICDCPARAFLKSIKGHSGYFACERCTIEGAHVHRHGVVLHSTDERCPLRTDEGFSSESYKVLDVRLSHQLSRSPLIDAGIPCVTGFPLEYMHLVCLGVVKRLIYFWKGGPRSMRRQSRNSNCILSANNFSDISRKLIQLNGKMPSEFARQPRCILDYERWKATEFRQFLLYTGPVVLKDILPEDVYVHFLSLSIAISLLLNGNDERRNSCLDYAEQLLVYFVNKSVSLYGNRFPVYNIHSLTHLCQDVEKHQCSLNIISAFQFENFLQSLKKKVKGRKNALVEVCKRLSEDQSFRITKIARIHKSLKISPGQLMGKNSCFMTSDSFVFVQEKTEESDYICKVLNKRFSENFFVNPCESKFLDIAFITRVNFRHRCEAKVFQRRQLTHKVVCIPYKDGWVMFPLLHRD